MVKVEDTLLVDPLKRSAAGVHKAQDDLKRGKLTLSDASIGDLRANTDRNFEVFHYDRSRVVPGIVHIGAGNFFRAHLANFVDRCLHLPSQEAWGIVGVEMVDTPDNVRKGEKVLSQDCLYTLTEYSPDGKSTSRVIGSIVDHLHAPSNAQAVLHRLASPDTRIVSMTITEGGYKIDERTSKFDLTDTDVRHDLEHPDSPKSVFGFLVQGLHLRRSAGLEGFTLLSCDNLRSNGNVARKALMGFARARDPELAGWIEQRVSFPNSMVDRITPAVTEAAAQRANAHTGVSDQTPIITESFIQWVAEDGFVSGRPTFERVGVQLRDDVAKFEVIKQRLLNASHSMLAYPALMCGHRTVDRALAHETIRAYLTSFMRRDVIPFVGESCPEGVDLEGYMNSILERFQNPTISDQILRIAGNGCAKFPVFLSKIFSTLLTSNGRLDRAALLVVTFLQYLKGRDMKGNVFTLDEPHLTKEDKELLGSGDLSQVLRISAFASMGLPDDESFRKSLTETCLRLLLEGPEAALQHAAYA